eukprot:TRINITY_DN3089_c0_g1_i2.p1 TRINITY_DN3089_c0_g1~~TRINITY_DN3089_c0_g1_i2.p1  ORF type:complete len:159 (+),score=46.74 TRINITY_DN3089_c0_g1_i2:1276-1752(+)
MPSSLSWQHLFIQRVLTSSDHQCQYPHHRHDRFRCHPVLLQLDELLASKGTKIDKVVNLEIDDDLLVKRITGRWIHPASGRSYNVFFNPPKVTGKDDETGEALIQRGDDTADKLRERLRVFHAQTQPVIDHYAKLGKVASIDASQEMAKVSEAIRRNL